jgi:hypothetical protein
MPLTLIDEIDAAPDRRGKFSPLCAWVEYALRELAIRDDHPPGLRLTPEEIEELRQYRAEQAGEL